MTKTHYFPNNPVTGFKQESAVTKQIVKTVEMPIKPIIYISDEIKSKLSYVCNKIPSNEWIGFIFYEIMEGGIDDMENLRLRLVDVAPLNIGHSASVMVNLSRDNEKIMKIYDNKPELEEYRRGLVHSHCNMGVFYSGTDTSEIEDNAPLYDMYLSIVVNNRGEICARIGIMGEEEVEYNTVSTVINRFKNSMGQWISKSENKNDEGKRITEVLYSYDLEIETESITSEDRFLIEQVDELIKSHTKPVTYANYHPKGHWDDYYNSRYGYNSGSKSSSVHKPALQTTLKFDDPATIDEVFSKKRAKEFLSYMINETHGMNIYTSFYNITDWKESAIDAYLSSRITDKLWGALERFFEYYNVDINNALEEAFDFVDTLCIEVLEEVRETTPRYEPPARILADIIDAELDRLREYAKI